MTGRELAERLQGRCICDGLIIIEREIPFGAHHGFRQIENGVAEALIFFGYKAGQDVSSSVFMDTETTGLSGGTGTLVFLLGLGRFMAKGLQLAQYFLTSFKGESALLEQAREFIKDAQTLITYNGKSFDHPLLAARYRLAGMKDPLAPLEHLDLLHPTRRAFGERWPDCRFQTVEERLIVFKRVGDIPGSKAPETWFDWVRHGITANLPGVVRHNRWDLVSLAVLLPALRRCYEDPVGRNANILACARHYRSQLNEAEAYNYLLANRPHLDHNALLELARLGRRRGEWALSVEIWRDLATEGNLEALERLAKYYEHVARDFSLALKFTRKLAQLDRFAEKHRRRENRLAAKLKDVR
ncbi:MAG: ribonuclease H-like domain-containing protein [Nitrospinota bacterium]